MLKGVNPYYLDLKLGHTDTKIKRDKLEDIMPTNPPSLIGSFSVIVNLRKSKVRSSPALVKTASAERFLMFQAGLCGHQGRKVKT